MYRVANIDVKYGRNEVKLPLFFVLFPPKNCHWKGCHAASGWYPTAPFVFRSVFLFVFSTCLDLHQQKAAQRCSKSIHPPNPPAGLVEGERGPNPRPTRGRWARGRGCGDPWAVGKTRALQQLLAFLWRFLSPSTVTASKNFVAAWPGLEPDRCWSAGVEKKNPITLCQKAAGAPGFGVLG